MTKHGEFNWNELQTRDAEKAIRFYTSAIGWSFEREETPTGGSYWIGLASEKPVCGILTLERNREGVTDRWVTYVHVNDLDCRIAKVRDLGGLVLRPPWEVPGVGRVAMVRDPVGADIGWVTPL